MIDLKSLKKKELQQLCEDLRIDYLPKDTKDLLKKSITKFYEDVEKSSTSEVEVLQEEVFAPEILVEEKTEEKVFLNKKSIKKAEIIIQKIIPKLYTFKEIVVTYKLSQYDVNYLKKCNLSSKVDTLDSWLKILKQKNILN